MIYKDFFAYITESGGLKFDELKDKRFKNPLTGKLIKVASALTYDHDTQPYKMAIEYLKLYGIDYTNKDTVDDTESAPTRSKSANSETKVNTLLDTSKLFFRFDKTTNTILISIVPTEDAVTIEFNKLDGILSLTLLTRGSVSDTSSFKKKQFYRVGDKYDLQVKKKNRFYTTIRRFLSDNITIIGRKMSELSSEDDFKTNDDKQLLYKELRIMIKSAKKIKQKK